MISSNSEAVKFAVAPMMDWTDHAENKGFQGRV